MQRDELWKKFEKRGKIEDYLAFKNCVKEDERHDDKDNGSDNPRILNG